MENKFKIFNNKKVLVTGNTGFKGSWLVGWLLHHNAEIIGFSNNIPTNPSHFSSAEMGKKINQIWGDVRTFKEIDDVVKNYKPDFIFHLAAQPLVRKSYSEPAETFETNVLGTLNVLEALRKSNHNCTAIFITSDKCYDNVEQVWGYREDDKLGGKDPYSGSKGAAELVIKSYAESFFKKPESKIRVAVGRAGNVIGGGDWAEDRIIPDAVRAWSNGEKVNIRNPRATRPWQLVLEPLSGYLHLAYKLNNDNALNGETFNFGPSADQNQSVAELLDEMKLHWDGAIWEDLSTNTSIYEAGLLKLCCDKALHYLDWVATLDFSETVEMTSSWYRNFYSIQDQPVEEIWKYTQLQIESYEIKAAKRGIEWAI